MNRTVLEEKRRSTVIQIIIQTFGQKEWFHGSKNPFEVLIGTILSQNTNDRNSIRAFQLLKKRIGIDPERLLKAEIDEIKECIKPAGLYNIKAPRIRSVAKYVHQNFSDKMKSLMSKSDDEIRATLSQIEGIGPKTIDVLLAFSGSRDILPVDTHVGRIARRLGFVSQRSSYNDVKKSLEDVVPRGMRIRAHIALIIFGRKICLSRRPRCEVCPVSEYCPSRELFISKEKKML